MKNTGLEENPTRSPENNRPELLKKAREFLKTAEAEESKNKSKKQMSSLTEEIAKSLT